MRDGEWTVNRHARTCAWCLHHVGSAHGAARTHSRHTAPQGMLAIGAALLGSSHVLGVDIDLDALELAQQNCDDFDDPLPVRKRPWHSARPMRCCQ